VQLASRVIGPAFNYKAALKISPLLSPLLGFIELAQLLGPKALTYGRIGPNYNLILMNS